MAQNRKTAESFYAAMAKGDIASFIGILDPQIVWNEADNFVYADRSPYAGVDAVLTGLFARLAGEWDGFLPVPEEFVDGGDTVVCLGHYVGTYKATGVKVHAQFVHVFKFTDGKLAIFHQYTDTAQFRDATGRRVTA